MKVNSITQEAHSLFEKKRLINHTVINAFFSIVLIKMEYILIQWDLYIAMWVKYSPRGALNLTTWTFPVGQLWDSNVFG